MCEVNLVKVQCVTVKLLTIFHIKIHKSVPKQLLQNYCYSITSRRSGMCVKSIGESTVCTVKFFFLL